MKAYLERLREIYKRPRHVAIYMDNASYHNHDSVKDFCKEVGFEIIWAPVYQPRYQPAEFLIGEIKKEIKKQRLIDLALDEPKDSATYFGQACATITKAQRTHG